MQKEKFPKSVRRSKNFLSESPILLGLNEMGWSGNPDGLITRRPMVQIHPPLFTLINLCHAIIVVEVNHVLEIIISTSLMNCFTFFRSRVEL